jgi:preprotein translocase subunit SecF
MSIFKKWWFWVIVVIIIIAVGSMGGKDTPKKTETTTTTVTQAQEQNTTNTPEFFKVGETAETKQVRATITRVEKSQGSQFNKPAEGNEFVLVYMTIENKSDKEIVVSSMLNFSAYVDDNAINEDLGAITVKEGNKTMDGKVAPGKKLSGVLGYQVPKGWGKLEIVYQPDVAADTKIKWVIENQ